MTDLKARELVASWCIYWRCRELWIYAAAYIKPGSITPPGALDLFSCLHRAKPGSFGSVQLLPSSAAVELLPGALVYLMTSWLVCSSWQVMPRDPLTSSIRALVSVLGSTQKRPEVSPRALFRNQLFCSCWLDLTPASAGQIRVSASPGYTRANGFHFKWFIHWSDSRL